jgi:hypothetical protein
MQSATISAAPGHIVRSLEEGSTYDDADASSLELSWCDREVVVLDSVFLLGEEFMLVISIAKNYYILGVACL